MTIANCGHEAQENAFSTGYAGIVPTNRESGNAFTLCFRCADEDARQFDIVVHDKVCYYLDDKNENVTTWSGGIIGKVIQFRKNAHQYWGRPGISVTVRDVNGVVWYGNGPAETGTYVNLRKRKADSR